MVIKFEKRVAKSRKVRNKISEPSSAQAMGKMFGALPTFSAAVGAMSVVGYLISWSKLDAYYSEVGAAWFPRTLQASSIISSGMQIYIALAIMIGLGLTLLMNGTSVHKLGLMSAISLVVGGLLSVQPLWLLSRLPTWAPSIMSLISFAALSIAVGLLVAELAGSLKESNLIWQAGHFSILMSIFFYALLPSVKNQATHQAKRDMNSAESTLPYIQKKNCAECIWRVLSINEGKALVGRISTEKSDRKFMLVTLDDSWEMSP
jgi:hypothetical protein